jgi:DNA-binding transcriptional MerR regulator
MLDTCERLFMTLAEIAEASGLPARTVRFYIARGLLNGPAKGGRVAAYTAEHVERLERIKHLQATGRTLSEICRILGGSSGDESEAVPATSWWQHAIADDVIVWVRADASPWRTKQIRAAVQEFARRVGPEKNGKGKESEIR